MKTEVFSEKSVPIPLCTPQIPHSYPGIKLGPQQC